MADGVSCKIAGLAELQADFERLAKATQERIMRGAMGTAASVFRKEAVRLAPMATGPLSAGHPPPGTLKKAIYQARLASKCTPKSEVWVVSVHKGKNMRHTGSKTSKYGPTQGTNKDAYYAIWVEFGHFARQPGKLKRKQRVANQQAGGVKWVPPRPFMRPAFASKREEAMRAYEQYMLAKTREALATAKILRML